LLEDGFLAVVFPALLEVELLLVGDRVVATVQVVHGCFDEFGFLTK
jgi:hypothetical protein